MEKIVRPDTHELTLPDGKKATVWRKDVEAIRRDVLLTGNVVLYRPEGSEVYEYVAWDSAEAKMIRKTGSFRHVA